MSKQENVPFWEDLYAHRDAPDTFGPPNPELMELLPSLPAGGRILDLGCGEGRLVLPFAEAGFKVTGLDKSPAGINKVQRLANERGVADNVEVRVVNLDTHSIEGEYDLIVSEGVFHNLHRENAERLIKEMKAHTRPGGYNLVKLFTTKVPPPPDLVWMHIGLWEEEELFDRYNDWEFLLRQSVVLHDEHPDGSEHDHPINKILARRPA